MRKGTQAGFGVVIILFLLPLIMNTFSFFPIKNVTVDEPDEKQITVIVATQHEVPPVNEALNQKKALFLFTHSHEAFIPMVQSIDGQTEVYSPTTNITGFSDLIKNQFDLNLIQSDFLKVDTMHEMKKTNRAFVEAYDVVRPFLAAKLHEKEFDLIIDLHRDSAEKKTTTLEYENESYGKLYFVVGEDHPNYKFNQSLAQKLSTQLNEMVPGISRGVIGKKGDHVDGIYNQDLAKNMVLIELGGIENTQEEINRTISLLAKAISIVLQNQSSVASI